MNMAANPIQIVPLRDDALAAPTPAQVPQLTYRGGPLIPAVQVFTFFWGAGWLQDPAQGLVQPINQFFDSILTSSLVDQLAEYSVPGSSIGHGARIGTLTVTTGPASASVTDADVQQFVQQQVASGMGVPQPTANSLYYVYLPPGVSVSLDGGASCTTFCGYHSDINSQIFYAVMPYPDCTGCTGGIAVLDALTSTSSHELCEAITDPVPGQGWYDDANGEIGDICAWKTKMVGAYTVQLEWSNAAGKCV
jgi:hypothetical protein